MANSFSSSAPWFTNINNRTILYWLVSGIFGLLASVYIAYFSHNFSYSYRVIEMPIFKMVGILCGLGLLYSLLYYVIKQSIAQKSTHKLTLLIILIFGLLFRLVMFTSEPMLEDDYQRYMWDGAISANGLNPYQHAPKDYIDNKVSSDKIHQIKEEAGLVLTRINHPDLRTIYPPVAQMVFALAYYIEPFSLTSWRFVLLIADIITITLLLKLLRHFNRSELWVALYWWNPVVIKELFNSTHMEAILIPFILTSILLALRKYFTFSSLALMCAAGVKVWPLALYPLILRPLWNKPIRLAFCLIPSVILGCLFLWPILMTTLDQKSGFVAYATLWKTNSALMPTLTSFYELTFSVLSFETIKAGIAARFSIVITLLLILVILFFQKQGTDEDWLQKVIILVFSIFLLSPAQFPWYYVWIAPFLTFMPLAGFLLLTSTISLYYIGFYYMSHDQLYIFNRIIIWVIWIPVWLLLLQYYFRPLRMPDAFFSLLNVRRINERR